jgi:hypothetical protein
MRALRASRISGGFLCDPGELLGDAYEIGIEHNGCSHRTPQALIIALDDVNCCAPAQSPALSLQKAQRQGRATLPSQIRAILLSN